MKKNSLSIIISIMMMFTFVIACTGCGLTEKPSITADTFISIMEGKNFEVINANNQLSESSAIKSLYVAVSPQTTYQLEFYEMLDDDSSQTLFNQIKRGFENSKGISSSSSSVAIGNYAKYTLTTNVKYKAISRIDNTLIFVNTVSESKEEIEEILKEIGY